MSKHYSTTQTMMVILSGMLLASASRASISPAEVVALNKQVKSALSSILERTGKKVTFEITEGDPQFSMLTRATNTENKYTIYTSSGVYKNPQMTRGTYLLMACHELGHVLGGAPYFGDAFSDTMLTPTQRMNLAHLSVEGQADYFSTNICFKRVMRDETILSQYIERRPLPLVVSRCRQTWTSTHDRGVCVVSSMLSQQLTRIYADVESASITPPVFHLDVAAGAVPSSTLRSYPTLQCRLDTMFAGALYDELKNANPGDHRPACWYVPTSEN